MNNIKTIFQSVILVVCLSGLIAVAIAIMISVARGNMARIAAFFRLHPANAILLPIVATLIVHGSTKPPTPPPVIVEQGITLTRCDVTPERATLEWSTSDDRIEIGTDTFQVQRRSKAFPFKGGWSPWETVGETTATNIVIEGWTLDKNTQYRIAVEKEAAE